MEAAWKCPECPYDSKSEVQLENHMNTIAHGGIKVKSETVKEGVYKQPEPEKAETEKERNSQLIASPKVRIEDVETDFPQNRTKLKKTKVDKVKAEEKCQTVQKCQNCPY